MIVENSDQRYDEYRIPGLVMTNKQTLIGYYECRKTHSDWADIDIKVIRSTDHGENWETTFVVEGKGNTLNNPMMIVDGEVIHFLYCKNYKQLFYRKSTDDGQTFTDATEITKPFETCGFYFSVLAVGPGHGIVHNGNILVPIWFAANKDDPFSHHPSFISTLCSKDGENWSLGEIIGKDYLVEASETALAVTADNTVLASIRCENDRRRALAISPNGVSDWQDVHLDDRMPDAICQGSMFHDGEYVYHINCTCQTAREDLTVKKTRDNFNTFEEIYVDKFGGYSDFVVEGNTLYVLYEHQYGTELIFKKISV